MPEARNTTNEAAPARAAAPPFAGRHLLLVRGTSWLRLRNWRVRLLYGTPRQWNLFATSEPLAEYHREMTPAEALRLTWRKFPGAAVYIRADDPNAPPRRDEALTVARVAPPA